MQCGVYKNAGDSESYAPYLLDVQADMLNSLETRIMVPLVRVPEFGRRGQTASGVHGLRRRLRDGDASVCCNPVHRSRPSRGVPRLASERNHRRARRAAGRRVSGSCDWRGGGVSGSTCGFEARLDLVASHRPGIRGHHFRRSDTRWSAIRIALAMIVNDGLTALAETKHDASTTYRLPRSWALQFGSRTLDDGSLPIRQVPFWWPTPSMGMRFLK